MYYLLVAHVLGHEIWCCLPLALCLVEWEKSDLVYTCIFATQNFKSADTYSSIVTDIN
jgi:hypothetical protein